MFALRSAAAKTAPLMASRVGASAGTFGRPLALGASSKAMSTTVDRRPMSPHVTIYEMSPAATTSISHRVTGVFMTGGFGGVAAISLLGGDVGAIMAGLKTMPVLATATKFALAFPLTYHYAAGVRHMFWDAYPSVLTTEEVTRQSYLLIGGVTLVAGSLSLSSF
eukprot:GFYU01001883.1.p1 GENE.GFYU01001883.1~~GFYU01001883.1.p1  ORF type:complete len:165 (-),score=39.67 GFYU01001883.1:509-1003(-)